MRFLKLAVSLIAALLFIGLGIGTGKIVPHYAVAYLNDASKTYITHPCVNAWQRRPAETIDTLRQGTVGEGQKLGYRSDEACKEAGGMVDDGRSLTGLLLEETGLLPPLKHWWDEPYRTEAGQIVYPGEAATKAQRSR